MILVFWGLFLILVFVVCACVNAIILKISYPAGKRYLHCRPLVALVVAYLALLNAEVLFPRLVSLTDAVINSNAFAALAAVVLPNRAHELLYMLVSMLFMNLIVLIGTAVLLFFVRLVFHGKEDYVDWTDLYGVQKVTGLPWVLVGRFYEHNEDGDTVLNGKGYSCGLWLSAAKKVFAALWLLETALLAVSVVWGGEEWNQTLRYAVKSLYLLPVCMFLIAEQAELMLTGRAATDMGSFSSSSIEERMRGGSDNPMADMVTVYMNTFGLDGALLQAKKGHDTFRKRLRLSGNDIGNQQLLDCRRPEVLTFLSNYLRSAGVVQNYKYQNALVRLLNGDSINVRDVNEGEFLAYLAAYFNYEISQARSMLILCQDNESAERMRDALTVQLDRFNGFGRLWNIASVNDLGIKGQIHVLVCSVDTFLTADVGNQRPDFISMLNTVVMTDCFAVFNRNEIVIEHLFSLLRKEDSIQYIMLSEVNNNELRTRMEKQCGKDLFPVSNDVVRPQTSVMVWKQESYYKIQRFLGIGDDVGISLGAAIPLALVAVKNDMEKVFILDDTSSYGNRACLEAMQGYELQIERYLNSGVNLSNVIRNDFRQALEPGELSIMIAYDRTFNLCDTIRRWRKYGGSEGTLLHIVSPQYMLREYCAANIGDPDFGNGNSGFEALVPYHLGLRKTQMMILLTALCGGMTEPELQRRCVEYGWTYHSAEEILRECINRVFPTIAAQGGNIYTHVRTDSVQAFNEEKNEYTTLRTFRLIDTDLIRRLGKTHREVRLDTGGGERLSEGLPVLSANVYNYYLRDQLLAHRGYIYRISSIGDDGTINGRQENPQAFPQYYPVSDFAAEAGTVCSLDPCTDNAFIDWGLYSADITRKIYGYWAGINGNDFSHPMNMMLYRITDNHTSPLVDQHAEVHILCLNLADAALGDKRRQIVRTLCYMLNELFKTLFPATWQNLYAAVADPEADRFYRDLETRGEISAEEEGILSSVIPSITGMDCVGRDGYTPIYIIEFSSVEYGMVKILYDMRERVLSVLNEYLKWYVENAEPSTGDVSEPDSPEAPVSADASAASDSVDTLASSEPEDAQTENGKASDIIRVIPRFLHCGGDRYPEQFAVEALSDLLKQICRSYATANPAYGNDGMIRLRCSFCGKSVVMARELKGADKRRICRECEDQKLTQKDEIRVLYEETLRALTEGYRFRLRHNLHLKFANASEIRRTLPAHGEEERLLSSYNPQTRQVLIETSGPRVAMQGALIRELTHAWQEENLRFSKVSKKASGIPAAEAKEYLREGHAAFCEVEFMREIGEEEYAENLEMMLETGTGPDAVGYRLLRFSLRKVMDKGSQFTPYTAMQQICGRLTAIEKERIVLDEG